MQGLSKGRVENRFVFQQSDWNIGCVKKILAEGDVVHHAPPVKKR
jgi:hypothetical protein